MTKTKRFPCRADEQAFIRTALLMHFPKQEIATFLGRDLASLTWIIKRHQLAPRLPRQSDLVELASNYGLVPAQAFEALDA